MSPSPIVTCENHPGAVCFMGGVFGYTWTCPACELEKLRNDMLALRRMFNEHLS